MKAASSKIPLILRTKPCGNGSFLQKKLRTKRQKSKSLSRRRCLSLEKAPKPNQSHFSPLRTQLPRSTAEVGRAPRSNPVPHYARVSPPDLQKKTLKPRS